MIVMTSEACKLDGVGVPGIPTLIRHRTSRVMEDPSDYFRYLRVDRNLSVKTVSEYAKKIKNFFEFLVRIRRNWRDVDDYVLRSWRNELHLLKKRNVKTVNAKLLAVWNFYRWCEMTGRLHNRVGKTSATYKYPINVEEREITRKGGDKVVVSTSPLALGGEEEANRHTPNADEILKAHKFLDGRHAERNGLILEWAEQTSARVGELMSITIDQIPTRPVIEKMAATEVEVLDRRSQGNRSTEDPKYWLDIKVVGKTGSRIIVAFPKLLLKTRNWIDGERQTIVDRRAKRDLSFVDKGILFLSDRGGALTTGAVSNIGSDLFKRAEVNDTSIHRLRAAYMNRLAQALVDYRDDHHKQLSDETIAFFLKQAAGWKDIWSVRHYVQRIHARVAGHLQGLAATQGLGNGSNI